MTKILISWIGATDIKAQKESHKIGVGPIAQAVKERVYSELALLSNYGEDQSTSYVNWLKPHIDIPVTLKTVQLTSPTNFSEIYQSASQWVSEKIKKYGQSVSLTFHISPGTPHMAAVWIILGKTKFPAELIESSKEHGVKTTSFPFDISADFIPDLLRGRDRELERLAAAFPSESPEFSDIIYRSNEMKRVILKARMIAPRFIPVLIEGESGTGKELLARAIHKSSTRKKQPFIPVNCGAIAQELIETELFGHEKGAFTGADFFRKGHFETADGGTLFLDEIGELPKIAQVKLLRVLQEGEIVRIGSSAPIQVDVRIIAATNKTLINEIIEGAFREDLFYRLAVAVLKLPPLREREGDINLLTDKLLEKINRECKTEPGFEYKKLTAAARNIILQHSWPGNVRELFNTLWRATVWSSGEKITEQDMQEALLKLPERKDQKDDIMNLSIDNGLELQKVLTTVARHYLGSAMKKTNNNKTQAAELLGLPSYQTLSNWLKKYGLE